MIRELKSYKPRVWQKKKKKKKKFKFLFWAKFLYIIRLFHNLF